jgi:hypothetical protein
VSNYLIRVFFETGPRGVGAAVSYDTCFWGDDVTLHSCRLSRIDNKVDVCCAKHAHVSRTEYSTPKLIDVA